MSVLGAVTAATSLPPASVGGASDDRPSATVGPPIGSHRAVPCPAPLSVDRVSGTRCLCLRKHITAAVNAEGSPRRSPRDAPWGSTTTALEASWAWHSPFCRL